MENWGTTFCKELFFLLFSVKCESVEGNTHKCSVCGEIATSSNEYLETKWYNRTTVHSA